MEKSMENVDIDLVYLWVDGSDPDWLKKKNSCLKDAGELDEEVVGDARFQDNDDLKYSLRSVEKFAPWINKIYIVTDNQIPEWLNINHPKIQIVDHSEILAKDCLPNFNSNAIATAVVYIEDLSEHFLLANDDCLFWNKVNKNFFYKKEKFLINRVKSRLPKEPDTIHAYHIMNAKKILKNEFNIFNGRYPHHNIDPYLKSDFLECLDKYKEFKANMSFKFRTNEGVLLTLPREYSIANGRGCYKKIKYRLFHKIFGGADSYQVTFYNVEKYKKRLEQLKPKLVCFNDTTKMADEDKKSMFSIRNAHFPQKSDFEL